MAKKNRQVYLKEQMERKLQNRLARMGGQVSALRRMLAEHRSCEDLLIQASAIKAAMNQVIAELFEGHMQTCVIENVRKGRGRAEWQVQELRKALNHVLRRL